MLLTWYVSRWMTDWLTGWLVMQLCSMLYIYFIRVGIIILPSIHPPLLGPDCGVNVTDLPYGATSNCSLGTRYTQGPCLVKCIEGFQYNATNYTCSINGKWTGNILCTRMMGLVLLRWQWLELWLNSIHDSIHGLLWLAHCTAYFLLYFTSILIYHIFSITLKYQVIRYQAMEYHSNLIQYLSQPPPLRL